MTRYLIKTTGKGILPEGRLVGFIEADGSESAEDALLKSGQVSERFRGHFAFSAELEAATAHPPSSTAPGPCPWRPEPMSQSSMTFWRCKGYPSVNPDRKHWSPIEKREAEP